MEPGRHENSSNKTLNFNKQLRTISELKVFKYWPPKTLKGKWQLPEFSRDEKMVMLIYPATVLDGLHSLLFSQLSV